MRLQGEMIRCPAVNVSASRAAAAAVAAAAAAAATAAAAAADVAGPHDTIVALQNELRAAEHEKRTWLDEKVQLRDEIRARDDRLDLAARQSRCEVEGLAHEHKATSAMMSHEFDVMMSELQGRTENVMEDLSAQLKHESRCFHDECSVAHGLRSAAAAAAGAADLALLAASKTHSTSPVSHLYRSPLGTPPKSLVACLQSRAAVGGPPLRLQAVGACLPRSCTMARRWRTPRLR